MGTLANRFIFVTMVALAVWTTTARETIFVMEVSNHGTSAPKYAANPEYDVTKNSYSKSGQITTAGIKQMSENGKNFRKEYIEQQKFMPSKFDPESVNYYSVLDQSSLMSAYSFNLGAYPDSVSYLEFTDGLPDRQALAHEKSVRKTLGLGESPKQASAKKIPIKTNEGIMSWRDPNSQCAPIGKKIQSNLAAASQSLDKSYRNSLFSQLENKFGKTANKLNFENTHYYLEDYISAKRQGASYPKFTNQASIDKMIDEYEKDYYYEGILGGNHVSRVISSPVLNYLLVTTFAKSEVDKHSLNDSKYKHLKYAHFFADEVPFASILKTLDYPQGQAPQPGDTIRFELFSTDGKQFVRSSLNGNQMNFGGSKQGIMDVDTFLKTIYPNLYFGKIDNVCSGSEDIMLNIYPRNSDYVEYLSTIHDEIAHIRHQTRGNYRVIERVVEAPRCVIAEPVIERVIPRPPPPPPPVRPRVVVEEVLVERPVPVIEERVVVHEVEKVVAEKPTHVHHVKLDIPEEPAALPLHFAEAVPDAGWPWWLLFLPLLCCIPLLAWLLCRKTAEPVIKPKQPLAPVGAKRLNKPEVKEIMTVRTEERHSPEKKYVIEKKVIDEGEDIEREIERELGKSRVIRESRQAAVLPRQTAVEIAAEGAYSRGSGGGRRRRIKTIKKFGQVIGKEEQILDEDGNIISTRKLGIDEYDPAANFVPRSESEYRAQEDYVVGSDTGVVGSRRGYSSGRHIDDVPIHSLAEPQTFGAGAGSGRFGAGSGSGRFADGSGRYGAGVGAGVSSGRYAGDAGVGSGLGSGTYGSGRHSEGRAYSSGRNSEGRGYSSGRHLAESEKDYGRYSPKGSRGNLRKDGYYIDDGGI